MPNVASGQTYGRRAEQQAAQRALPVGPPPPSAAPAPMTAPAAAPAAPMGPLPGSLTPLTAPTARPGEPVMAGVPMGAGPGVEALGALGQAGSEEDVVMALRAAYDAYPSEDLRLILERLDLS